MGAEMRRRRSIVKRCVVSRCLVKVGWDIFVDLSLEKLPLPIRGLHGGGGTLTFGLYFVSILHLYYTI